MFTLGKLGTDWKPTIRKFRWLFEGFDKDNLNIIQSIVKVSHRPDFPYMLVADENGGKEVCLPGEISITQFFTFYDEKDKAGKEFKEAFDNSIKVVSAKLVILDGCGVPVEHWLLEDVKMTLNPAIDIDDPDDIIAEWKVVYQKSVWEQL